MLTMPEFPAFISGSFVKSYPIYGNIAKAIGCLFVERADANSRAQVLEQLKERVKKIQENENWPQLCIFPEGCTTNGKTLLKFKRGAFEVLEPIQPIYIEYQSPFCIASYDSFPTVLHGLFMLCQPFSRIIIHRLPVLYPTEEMFIKYARLGSTRPEIFAEVTREIYCHTFNLGKSSQSLVDKGKLLEYLYDFSKQKYE